MNRRDLLKGIAGICATGIAPAFIGSSILMPTRKLWEPKRFYCWPPNDIGAQSINGIPMIQSIHHGEVVETDIVGEISKTGTIIMMPHGIIAGFTQRALKMSVVQNPHEWPRWPE